MSFVISLLGRVRRALATGSLLLGVAACLFGCADFAVPAGGVCDDVTDSPAKRGGYKRDDSTNCCKMW
jgi:hypothetical protein